MTVHIPVLLHEVIDGLNLKHGSVVVDGTMGGGGHSRELLKHVGPNGKVLAFDRDSITIDRIDEQLDDPRFVANAANYADIPEYLDQLGFESVDAILLDLGLSSDQLADPMRGFSFQSDGPLDLRFDTTSGEPAWKLVNRLSERHLADLIYQFGEERLSRRVARRIVAERRKNEIRSANHLAQVVRSCVGRSKNHSIDPATRTFQAFRIAVNEELKWLNVALKRLPTCLSVGGRLGIISFHSLEDRMVKHAFLDNPALTVLTKKPIQAGEQELLENPRSRSAKFRIAEKN